MINDPRLYLTLHDRGINKRADHGNTGVFQPYGPFVEILRDSAPVNGDVIEEWEAVLVASCHHDVVNFESLAIFKDDIFSGEAGQSAADHLYFPLLNERNKVGFWAIEYALISLSYYNFSIVRFV